MGRGTRFGGSAASGAGGLLAANNLSDVANAGTACTNLGLTALATTTPAANVAAFLATPSSSNLAAAVTDETGTGLLVLNNGATLIGPALGTPASGVLTNCTGLPVASIVGLSAGAGLTYTAGVFSNDTDLLTRRYFWAMASGTNGAILFSTTCFATATGTPVALLNADDADGPWRSSTSVLTAANKIVQSSGTQSLRTDWLPDLVIRIKTDPVALPDTGMFVGFSSAQTCGTAIGQLDGLHGFGLRYTPSLDGTAFWRYGTADNNTPTFTASTLAVAANTVYLFRIKFNSTTSVSFYYWSGTAWVLMGTNTTHTPTATTLLYLLIMHQESGAVARSVLLNRVNGTFAN